MSRTACLAPILLLACLSAEEAGPRYSIPSMIDFGQLALLATEASKIRLQYDPGRLSGTLAITDGNDLDAPAVWQVFTRALTSAGMATIATEDPQVQLIVPLAEAPGSAPLTTLPALRSAIFPPTVATIIHKTQHIPSDQALKLLVSFAPGGQSIQARSLGTQRLALSGTVASLFQADATLTLADVPGQAPAIRMITPLRSQPQTLASAAMQGWSSIGRLRGSEQPADIQVAPDGRRIVILAPAESIDDLVAFVDELDRSEPVETRSYRPRWFALTDVASLLRELASASGQPAGTSPVIVIDRLTSSLLVTATASQHQRIATLLSDLDQVPESSRRQVKAFSIRNRSASMVAQTLSGLLAAGAAEPGATQESTSPPAALQPTTAPAPPANNEARKSESTTTTTTIAGATLVADDFANRIIAVGEPRLLDEIGRLLEELDLRQPQVQLDVTLVGLSSSQNRDLGVELIGQATRNEISVTAMSLFGLSTVPPGSPTTPTVGAPAGLSGMVINPGDYAGIVRALETINSGNAVIQSTVIVNNNAKAEVQSVVQEPITSINSGEQVATTTFAGTTDAGTQLELEPQIATGDHITLTYRISQSAFLGSPTISGGSVIPPTKRSDSVTSVATIPDGFVIALGGLSNANTKDGESRIPWLGQVPGLGLLFKQQTTGTSDSRFYVFIKATILRDQTFRDLKLLSNTPREAAGDHAPTMPSIAPQWMK